MPDFNTALYRNIKSGYEFDHLIPKTTCKSSSGGNGDTDLSITLMAQMINQYAWQGKELSKKLQGATLQETISNSKYFAFNYNQ